VIKEILQKVLKEGEQSINETFVMKYFMHTKNPDTCFKHIFVTCPFHLGLDWILSEIFKNKPARYKEPRNNWIKDNIKSIPKQAKNVLKVLHTHRNGGELYYLHSEIERYKKSWKSSE
jgi:hypothetical protein